MSVPEALVPEGTPTMMSPPEVEVPDFDSLPPVEGQPQGCAWGLWGKDDELGTLNLLTAARKLEAAKEIKAGVSLSLDMPLDFMTHMIAHRIEFEQKIIDFKDLFNSAGHDDELHFNTQGGSQWDGFTHSGTKVPGAEFYYNGQRHEDVKKKRDGRNGIQKWIEAGAIVGRGVLLDYVRWRAETNQPPAAADSAHSITVAELEAVAAYQSLTLKPGDILLVRGGWTLWYEKASQEERVQKLERNHFIGVERSMEMVRWLWNHHFAAVATDSIGFEQCPPPFGKLDQIVLHTWLLVWWGTPLGELWNLEDLSRVCAERKQWSFFFTSHPLNVKGGVGSPPNAVAVL